MSLVSCHVQKYTQNKDGYTEYFILVLYQGREWAVRKRYSDFSKFDEYLRNSGYSISYQLPEKNWWNKFDPTLLSKRLKELQNYLDVLLREEMSAQDSLVREFLEVDENMLALAKKQPFREATFADRMVQLVKQMRKDMIGIPSHRESLGGDNNYSGRNHRENSKYYRDDSPGGTPRQRSKDGGFVGGGAVAQMQRRQSGSFSGVGSGGGGFGGVLRIGIGSFSGNVGTADAAQAVADAARREAFAEQSARLWLLVGKQVEAKLQELAHPSLPVPADPNASSDSIQQALGAPVEDLATWLELLDFESDSLAETLPKNTLVMRAGDPSQCVVKWVSPAIDGPASASPSPSSTPRARVLPREILRPPLLPPSNSPVPSPSPSPSAAGAWGKELRRINSEGKASKPATTPRQQYAASSLGGAGTTWG